LCEEKCSRDPFHHDAIDNIQGFRSTDFNGVRTLGDVLRGHEDKRKNVIKNNKYKIQNEPAFVGNMKASQPAIIYSNNCCSNVSSSRNNLSTGFGNLTRQRPSIPFNTSANKSRFEIQHQEPLSTIYSSHRRKYPEQRLGNDLVGRLLNPDSIKNKKEKISKKIYEREVEEIIPGTFDSIDTEHSSKTSKIITGKDEFNFKKISLNIVESDSSDNDIVEDTLDGTTTSIEMPKPNITIFICGYAKA